ncbi:TPA: hypothetical protein QCS32_003414 [Bacillus thuringiensis]|uniref:Uncharacterized protein n=1 Tax=Bacillus thuringiensis serovar iberica TaxID=180866 RepID=A0A9X6QMM3_BACTU|nr:MULTISPECIES: hypothetical protein [Bacillus cereus group]MDM5267957.1 hypothetical protein [Bacillus wiedmannii]MEB9623271.1 hypothetical protein [Bacillus cereus]OUB46035.1 hypothetical protein BK741_19980 [Bacillus thuringiensis serovar iberica]HDR5351722.1 hypothetical protein [Bacillus thuringiensis]
MRSNNVNDLINAIHDVLKANGRTEFHKLLRLVNVGRTARDSYTEGELQKALHMMGNAGFIDEIREYSINENK